MTLDTPALVRIGQAVNACYDPFFLDRPERAVLPAPHSVIWGNDSDGPRPYGAIYLDPVLEAWVVLLRGTDSIPEWLSDATALLVDCPYLPGTRTHKGFTEIYETLRVDGDSIRAHLIVCERPIIVAGHSLGAALATLVAAAIGGADLVTFAGPRCGDEGYAAAAITRLASNHRIVNAQDIVPKLPAHLEPLFPFTHVGPAIDLDSAGQVIEDPKAWHDLETYLHLLDPSQPIDPQYAPAPA